MAQDNRDNVSRMGSQNQIDLNTATVEQFTQLGIPQDRARSIVEWRGQHGGRFQSVDDLYQISGLDRSLVDQYRSRLTVGKAA